jgi:ABC-type transporter Mla MlaB component
MLRITKKVNGQSTLIKLEGTLREAWLSEVANEVSRINASASNLKLDLSDVTFADQAGIALLGTMLRQGAQIVACSGFISASLGLEKP